MTKKIILSLALIGATGAITAGATMAWFTDVKTASGMTLSSGTIEITDASDPWMRNLAFGNFQPGDFVRKWVVLKNTGSLDIGYLGISAVNKSGDVDLLDNINVTVYAQVPGYDQGIYTPDWGKGKAVNTHLNDINVLGTAVYRDATAAKILAPSEKITLILDFRAPTTLGNEWQGKSAVFDIRFDAEQTH